MRVKEKFLEEMRSKLSLDSEQEWVSLEGVRGAGTEAWACTKV